ncbi:MAG: hypothetical protein WCF85_03785 [Rhodospirillaceae bacterium]
MKINGRLVATLLLTTLLALSCPLARAGEHGGAAPAAAHGGAAAAHGGGHGGEAEETAPETFVVLDLFSEALEASVAGIGIKIAELKPKVEHVNELYNNGEHHKALAKTLGISTELVLLGFLIETLGVGELFVSALSFSGNWIFQLAQSTAGILASTKVALFAGEKVEEATEEKYEHDIHAEAKARAKAAARAGKLQAPKPRKTPQQDADSHLKQAP